MIKLRGGQTRIKGGIITILFSVLLLLSGCITNYTTATHWEYDIEGNLGEICNVTIDSWCHVKEQGYYFEEIIYNVSLFEKQSSEWELTRSLFIIFEDMSTGDNKSFSTTIQTKYPVFDSENFYVTFNPYYSVNGTTEPRTSYQSVDPIILAVLGLSIIGVFSIAIYIIVIRKRDIYDEISDHVKEKSE